MDLGGGSWVGYWPQALAPEAAVVLAAVRDGATAVDEIVRASGLGPGAVAARLAELEVAGLVAGGDGRFRAVPGARA